MIARLKIVPQRAALVALRGYRWLLSPLLPAACRYTPTCSQYALEAVERHGFLRGGLMAAWRVLRCHPFARSGYDPVKERRQASVFGRQQTATGSRLTTDD